MADEESFRKSFDSLAVASEWKRGEEPRPINVPIFSSSTFKVSSVAHGEELASGKVRTQTLTKIVFHHFRSLQRNPKEFPNSKRNGKILEP